MSRSNCERVSRAKSHSVTAATVAECGRAVIRLISPSTVGAPIVPSDWGVPSAPRLTISTSPRSSR